MGLLQQRITCSSTQPQNSSTTTRKPHTLHSYFKSFCVFAGAFFFGVALVVFFLAADFAGFFAAVFFVVLAVVFLAGIYDLPVSVILFSIKRYIYHFMSFESRPYLSYQNYRHLSTRAFRPWDHFFPAGIVTKRE
jgi:hypothetical protein